MNSETLDDLSPMLPADFFTFEMTVHPYEKMGDKLKKKHQLPDLSDLLIEESFASLAIGWSAAGLRFDIEVERPFVEAFYPDVLRGDSVELFIDTRNLKSAGFPTRFCHHFAFLPKPVDGIQAVEKTRLRPDEMRELAPQELLKVESVFKRRGYQIQIFLPSEALHGYDPKVFEKLGFAFRINRSGGDPMHFPLCSDQFEIGLHPSLWSSLKIGMK
ncbi:MAG: hypothetical protein K940chlam2_00302 [Chlamydiae bacterium]|nr:hypothetical protein [Chlamydiota bacterium]